MGKLGSNYPQTILAGNRLADPIFHQMCEGAGGGVSLILAADAAMHVLSDIHHSVLPSITNIAYVVPTVLALFCVARLGLVQRAHNQAAISDLESFPAAADIQDVKNRSTAQRHLSHVTLSSIIFGASAAFFSLALFRGASIAMLLPSGFAGAGSLYWGERNYDLLFDRLNRFRVPFV